MCSRGMIRLPVLYVRALMCLRSNQAALTLQMMGLLDSDTHPVRPEAIRKAMENLDTPRRVLPPHTQQHTILTEIAMFIVSYLCLHYFLSD